jgi:hypothetical protein
MKEIRLIHILELHGIGLVRLPRNHQARLFCKQLKIIRFLLMLTSASFILGCFQAEPEMNVMAKLLHVWNLIGLALMIIIYIQNNVGITRKELAKLFQRLSNNLELLNAPYQNSRLLSDSFPSL